MFIFPNHSSAYVHIWKPQTVFHCRQSDIQTWQSRAFPTRSPPTSPSLFLPLHFPPARLMHSFLHMPPLPLLPKDSLQWTLISKTLSILSVHGILPTFDSTRLHCMPRNCVIKILLMKKRRQKRHLEKRERKGGDKKEKRRWKECRMGGYYVLLAPLMTGGRFKKDTVKLLKHERKPCGHKHVLYLSWTFSLFIIYSLGKQLGK